jgi:hypothetical protein
MSNATSKLETYNFIEFAEITDISVLKNVLTENLKFVNEEITKLTFSSSPEDNSRRLMLLGKRELLINLLSRIGKEN